MAIRFTAVTIAPSPSARPASRQALHPAQGSAGLMVAGGSGLATTLLAPHRSEGSEPGSRSRPGSGALPCGPGATAVEPSAAPLPSALLSSRVVVISDFNCPYCFTLNEWLGSLGLADAVRWVGVEHKPHLPRGLSDPNRPDDRATLIREVEDVSRRAPEVGVTLPSVWLNSHAALLVQAYLEDEHPELAHRVRQGLFRGFWRQGLNISADAVIEDCLRQVGLVRPAGEALDEQDLATVTGWWARELDRIPCMLAPTGARHLGLQDRPAVEAFVLGALRDRAGGEGCR